MLQGANRNLQSIKEFKFHRNHKKTTLAGAGVVFYPASPTKCLVIALHHKIGELVQGFFGRARRKDCQE